MRKKRKGISFAKRLTRRVLLTLFVVMSGVSYLIYNIALEVLEDEEEQRFEIMMDWEAEYVRRSLSKVKMAALASAYAFELTLDRPDELQELVERIVRDNVSVRSCGISFVEGYYPQKGRLFMPFVEQRGDSILVRDKHQPISNYLEEEWFIEALKCDSGSWSKAFLGGKDGKTPIIAYTKPIHDKKGRVAAVLGVDFSLDMLRDKLQRADNKVNKDGGSTGRLHSYSFIVDGSGTYLAHPDSTLILKGNMLERAKALPDTTILHIAKQMVSGQRGIIGETDDGQDIEIEGRAFHLFFTPVKTTDLSIGIVVPNLALDLYGYVFGVILLFFIFVGLLVVFIAIRFGIRRMFRPLKRLTISAEEVAQGHFDTPLPKIKHLDEIGLLRDSFEFMQQSLVKYVDELTTTAAQKASIESELTIASQIQMSMLPKVFPPYPERSDIDIYGMLTPAKDVGGDLFDFYIRDNKLFFCIGDVSGKGVPASLVMAVTRFLFRNISSHVSEPDKIVKALNEALAERNETNMFVTIFVGVLNLMDGHMLYCNAGHDAPLLIGQGVGFLPCDSNLPVGVMSGTDFSLQETIIYPQSTIFLFTDGLNEAEDIAHGQFGEQRIISLAETLLAEGKNQPVTIINEMEKAVRAFAGEAEQSDDLTLFAVQYKPHAE